MAYYTYILYSESFDCYYIGQCQDLVERLQKHNRGYNQSTKPYRPWRLVAWKESATRSLSMDYEQKLKNLRSRTRMFEFIDRHEFTRSETIE